MSNSPVFRFTELPSTQTKALELLEAGEARAFWVIAKNQTNGRGRLERKWQSSEETSFTASFGFQTNVRLLEGLSLVVGLGVLEGLPQNSQLSLKWPNDLMLGDDKIGGILIESRSLGESADVAVGIGLNLFDLKGADGVWYRGLGRAIDESIFYQAVQKKVEAFLDSKDGFKSFAKVYEKSMWGFGKKVNLSVQGRSLQVEILGVTEKGLLNTRDAGVLQVLPEGEISGLSS